MSRSFAVFFSLYMLIYGSMHVFVYFKLRSAIGRGWKWTALFILVSLAMIVGARALWLFDFGDAHTLRKVLSYSGYVWMAFIFMTFACFVLIDLLRILLWGIDGMLSSRFGELLRSPAARAWIAVGAAVLICAYGWFEALSIRTVYKTVSTPQLPPGVERIRIAQLSDVHLGWIIQEERLALMLDAVKAADPDMLVITGDLVDGNMEEREAEVALFRGLDLPLGTYAVTGNHEYYAGVKQALAFKEHSGMKVLRNEAVEAGGIILAGVDDRAARRFGEEPLPESKVLEGLPLDRGCLRTASWCSSSTSPMSIPTLWGCLTSSFRGIPTAARSGPFTGRPGRSTITAPVFGPSSPRRGAGRLMPLLPGGRAGST